MTSSTAPARDLRRIGLAVLLAPLLLATGVVPRSAGAQEAYPTKAVTIVVPFGAGGFTDTVARLLAKGLTEKWGSPVIVDDRPGAGGNLGGGLVAKATPDGYTLLLANAATNGINPAIYKKMGFDALNDFEPIVLVVKSPNLLSVSNDLPVHSVKELVALAKAKPGVLNFGYPGNGTTGHLTGVLFESVAGVSMSKLPYKSSPQVMTDMQGGQVQVAFDNVTSWAPTAQAGRVRGLAVTSAKRSPLMPDVPTMAEAGYPQVEATSWSGLAAPKGTPRAIVEKINADALSVMQRPDFVAAMNGGDVSGGTPQQFRQFIGDEIRKWSGIAQSINLTVD